MAVAVPIALVLIVALAGAAAWTMPPGALAIRQRTGGGAPHGGWTAGQRNAAIAFAVAVILWIGPSVLGAIAPDAAFSQWAIARVTEPIAAIVAATLLFVLPVDWARRQFTLGWTEASRIDWGTILLLGGGFSLGRLMFRTGLAEQIASSLVAVSGAESLWAITAIATAVAIIMTELTSNTATANMLVPVAISLSQVAGVNPIPPALGTGLGVSLAFMLPVSTPSNAIVYGTGLVPIRTMIRFGILMDVVGFAIIVAGLRVMCPLLGLA
jgi:sodium-dependent dicarboxylate transporter 2/3/5